MSIEQLYEIYLRHPSVKTDTRSLQPGDLFFALKGPSFNGNTFAIHALQQGAAYAIIDEPPIAAGSPSSSPDPRLILVPDVLSTLQQLALHHRRQFRIPFIAITGSNGKTTTKELIHAVLSAQYITYTTQGNLNNHIGIPLTLLSVRPDAQFAVIEMGANHQKEIEGYCRYTLPTHGIITNIGKAHLEGFGGPEGVRKGKGELYDFLRTGNGTAFVLNDSAVLREMSRGIPHIITYGTPNTGDSNAADITGLSHDTARSFLAVDITRGAATGTIHTQLVGDYNLPNVLVAVAVGKHFGVPDEKIHRSIEQYTPSNSRSQLIERDGNHIILDAYNANPSSMRAAIENFARLPIAQPANPQGPSPQPSASTAGSPPPTSDFPQKVLILGAMAELGPESLNEHRAIISLISQYPWRQVALVGGDFEKIDHPYLRFADSKEAGHWLSNAGFHNTYILLKGSRSSKMEQVLPPL